MVPTYCIQRYTAYLFQHSIMVKNAFPLDTVWLVYNLLKLVTKKKCLRSEEDFIIF